MGVVESRFQRVYLPGSKLPFVFVHQICQLHRLPADIYLSYLPNLDKRRHQLASHTSQLCLVGVQQTEIVTKAKKLQESSSVREEAKKQVDKKEKEENCYRGNLELVQH